MQYRDRGVFVKVLEHTELASQRQPRAHCQARLGILTLGSVPAFSLLGHADVCGTRSMGPSRCSKQSCSLRYAITMLQTDHGQREGMIFFDRLDALGCSAMTVAVHVSRINLICPVLEEVRHLAGMLHEMRNVKVADIDFGYVQPLTDQCRMPPAMCHILAGKSDKSARADILQASLTHKSGLNTLIYMSAGSFFIARMERYSASVASRDSLNGSWLLMSSSNKTRSASSGIVSLRQYCTEIIVSWVIPLAVKSEPTEKYQAVVAGIHESRLSSCCC